jgi:hypothetical protein
MPLGALLAVIKLHIPKTPTFAEQSWHDQCCCTVCSIVHLPEDNDG